MFKPLLRTLPTLSGNVKLACNLSDFNKLSNTDFECYSRYARLLPLDSQLYQKNISVSLLESAYEYDIQKFYKWYTDSFYKSSFSFNKKDYIQHSINKVQKQRDIDFEYGCKRISYLKNKHQFAFFTPIYIESEKDIPDYFLINIKLQSSVYSSERTIRVNLANKSTNSKNYLYGYLYRYSSQIDGSVIYCLPPTKQSTYYGIDVRNGGFTSIVDNLVSTIFLKQNTINNVDSIITNGFKRNSLVMKQIIPLCFYFNINDIFDDYDISKFANSEVYISGCWYKNGVSVSFNDFSIDYTNFTQSILKINSETGILDYVTSNYNIMDIDFPSLNESKYVNYTYTNKISPMYTRWKLKYSSDKHPYIINMSPAFNKNQDSDYKYGIYPDNFTSVTGFTTVYNNLLIPLGNSITSTTSPYYGKPAITNKYIKIFNNYGTTWFTNVKSTEDKFSKSNWIDVVDNKAFYNGILYNFENIYNDYPNLKKIDKFAVFTNVNFDIIGKDDYLTWTEKQYETNDNIDDYDKRDKIVSGLNRLVKAKYTINNSQSNITTTNCTSYINICDNLLNPSFEEGIENIPKIFENEIGTGQQQSQVEFGQLFLSTQNKDGDYINLSQYGFDFYDKDKYYKVSDVINDINESVGCEANILESFETVANYKKYFINGFEFLQVYALNQLYNTNNEFILNSIGDTLYFSQENNFNKVQYNSDLFKEVSDEDKTNKSKYSFFNKTYFISYTDLKTLFGKCLSTDYITYTTYLNQYIFEPQIENSHNEVIGSNAFTKLSTTIGGFYGDDVPAEKLSIDRDTLYVDPYNINNLISNYNITYNTQYSYWCEGVSGELHNVDAAIKYALLYNQYQDEAYLTSFRKLWTFASNVEELQDSNSYTFYANFLNSTHLRWYLTTLFNNANNVKDLDENLDNLYIKHRVLIDDKDNSDVQFRDIYKPVWEYSNIYVKVNESILSTMLLYKYIGKNSTGFYITDDSTVDEDGNVQYIEKEITDNTKTVSNFLNSMYEINYDTWKNNFNYTTYHYSYGSYVEAPVSFNDFDKIYESYSYTTYDNLSASELNVIYGIGYGTVTGEVFEKTPNNTYEQTTISLASFGTYYAKTTDMYYKAIDENDFNNLVNGTLQQNVYKKEVEYKLIDAYTDLTNVDEKNIYHLENDGTYTTITDKNDITYDSTYWIDINCYTYTATNFNPQYITNKAELSINSLTRPKKAYEIFLEQVPQVEITNDHSSGTSVVFKITNVSNNVNTANFKVIYSKISTVETDNTITGIVSSDVNNVSSAQNVNGQPAFSDFSNILNYYKTDEGNINGYFEVSNKWLKEDKESSNYIMVYVSRDGSHYTAVTNQENIDTNDKINKYYIKVYKLTYKLRYSYTADGETIELDSKVRTIYLDEYGQVLNSNDFNYLSTSTNYALELDTDDIDSQILDTNGLTCYELTKVEDNSLLETPINITCILAPIEEEEKVYMTLQIDNSDWELYYLYYDNEENKKEVKYTTKKLFDSGQIIEIYAKNNFNDCKHIKFAVNKPSYEEVTVYLINSYECYGVFTKCTTQWYLGYKDQIEAFGEDQIDSFGKLFIEGLDLYTRIPICDGWYIAEWNDNYTQITSTDLVNYSTGKSQYDLYMRYAGRELSVNGTIEKSGTRNDTLSETDNISYISCNPNIYNVNLFSKRIENSYKEVETKNKVYSLFGLYDKALYKNTETGFKQIPYTEIILTSKIIHKPSETTIILSSNCDKYYPIYKNDGVWTKYTEPIIIKTSVVGDNEVNNIKVDNDTKDESQKYSVEYKDYYLDISICPYDFGDNIINVYDTQTLTYNLKAVEDIRVEYEYGKLTTVEQKLFYNGLTEENKELYFNVYLSQYYDEIDDSKSYGRIYDIFNNVNYYYANPEDPEVRERILGEFMSNIIWHKEGYWTFSDNYAKLRDIDKIAGIIDYDGYDKSDFKFEVCYKKRFLKLNLDLWEIIGLEDVNKPYKDLYIYRVYKPEDFNVNLKIYYTNDTTLKVTGNDINDCLTPLFNSVYLEDEKSSVIYSNYSQSKLSKANAIYTSRNGSTGYHTSMTYAQAKYIKKYPQETFYTIDTSEYIEINKDNEDYAKNTWYNWIYIYDTNCPKPIMKHIDYITNSDKITLVGGSYTYYYLPFSMTETSLYTQWSYYDIIENDPEFEGEYWRHDKFYRYNMPNVLMMFDWTNSELGIKPLKVKQQLPSGNYTTINYWTYTACYNYWNNLNGTQRCDLPIIEGENSQYLQTYEKVPTTKVSFNNSYDDLGIYNNYKLSTYTYSYTYMYTYNYTENVSYLVKDPNNKFLSYYILTEKEFTKTEPRVAEITYGFFDVNVDFNNTCSSLNIIDTEYYNKKYITYINSESIYDEDYDVVENFKYLVPFLKTSMLTSFYKDNKLIVKPKTFNIDSQYKTYPIKDDNGNVLTYTTIFHKYSLGINTMERYFDNIVPFITEKNVINNSYQLKFKSTLSTPTISYTNLAIYPENVNISSFNGQRVYNIDGTYTMYTPPEYKHFNDNKFYNLETEITILAGSNLTYKQMCSLEEQSIVVSAFKKYINSNKKDQLDDNQILFLYNKYSVEYDSVSTGLNATKTEKVYTLKYKFILL